MQTEIKSGNVKGRSHLKDLRVDGKIILKIVLKKLDVSLDWINFI
jgi:hypothetical protein